MPYKDSNKAKEYRKKYYLEHSEELIKYQKVYRVLNKNKISKMKKIYYLNNLDMIKERKKTNYNPERIKKRDELYYKKNREKVLANRKEYYLKNKEKIKAYHDSNKQRRNQQMRERRRTDLIFRLKDNLRSRTNEIFRKIGQKKPTSTKKLLGESYAFIKVYIEKQFKKGMSWDNYGVWQIDHIIPLASAKDEGILRELCLYTNLQPLWAMENNSKKDKIYSVENLNEFLAN